MWCAAQANGVPDPYRFDNQTVRGADYNHLIDTYVRTQAPNFPSNALFQQDGAHPHTDRQARALLNEISPDSWIGKYGSYNWSPKFPDLTPPDFSCENMWRIRCVKLQYRTWPNWKEE